MSNDQKHTPEPWFVNDQQRVYVRVPGDEWQHIAAVTTVGDALMPGEGEANARRIVACVNACEGISTETLELTPGTNAARIQTLVQQRDALMAFAERVASLEQCIYGHIVEDARAAIASVKGGA